MAAMSDDDLAKMRLKIRDGLARLARRKLRDMRRRSGRPRSMRLSKEARILKALIAEARAVGVK